MNNYNLNDNISNKYSLTVQVFLFGSDQFFGSGLAHGFSQTLSSQTVSGSQQSILYRLTGHPERFFAYEWWADFVSTSLCGRVTVRRTMYLGGFKERNREKIYLTKWPETNSRMILHVDDFFSPPLRGVKGRLEILTLLTSSVVDCTAVSVC